MTAAPFAPGLRPAAGTLSCCGGVVAGVVVTACVVTVGAVVGVALGFGSAQVLRGLLYGVGAGDPLTFVAAPMVLLLVGVIAAYLPARRAGRVDPASVMRSE